MTSLSGGLVASPYSFTLCNLSMWFLNIPLLVNQGRVGFMLFTISVIASYLRTSPLLAFATSTFLATMSSAMSQVYPSRLAGLFLYAEQGLLLLFGIVLLEERSPCSFPPGAVELVLVSKSNGIKYVNHSSIGVIILLETREIYGAISCGWRF
jgi:hypothetical protein